MKTVCARRPRSATCFNTGAVCAAAAASALVVERVRRIIDGLPMRRGVHVEYRSTLQSSSPSSSPPVCVVFEAGSNSWSTVWAPVSKRVARYARTFAYDRPGFARSGYASPSSVKESANRLISLLREEGAGPPYILVAHSLGALYINEVVRRLPAGDVLGVVYVDAASLETVRELRNVVPNTVTPRWIASALGALGVLRIISPLLVKPYANAFESVPVLWKEARATWARGEWLRAYTSEWAMAMREADEGREKPDGWLAGMPISVIVPDVYERTEGKAFVGQMQRRLARYSNNANVFTVKNCGHFVQLERPDVVADAINDVLRRAHLPQGSTSGAGAHANREKHRN